MAEPFDPRPWGDIPLMDVEAVEGELRRQRRRLGAPEELWLIREGEDPHRLQLFIPREEGGSEREIFLLDLSVDGVAFRTRAQLEVDQHVICSGRDARGGELLFQEFLRVAHVNRDIHTDAAGHRYRVYGGRVLRENSQIYKALLDSLFLAQANRLDDGPAR